MSRSRKISLREQLRALLRQHPDWTNKQYAAHLGQTPDTIRGARHAMREAGTLEKLKKSKKTKLERQREKSKSKPVIYRQEINRRTLTSRTVGYLKLL